MQTPSGTGARERYSWRDLEHRVPDLAAAGRALLAPGGGAPIGFLATGAAGVLHMAPVCPIFCDGDVYLSVAADSPKRRDLDLDGRYVLHAFLGADDTEFQVSGRAEEVAGKAGRQRVQAAIEFGTFGGSDPIYRLAIERCLMVRWIDPGQPGTRAERRRFPAGKGGG